VQESTKTLRGDSESDLRLSQKTPCIPAQYRSACGRFSVSRFTAFSLQENSSLDAQKDPESKDPGPHFLMPVIIDVLLSATLHRSMCSK